MTLINSIKRMAIGIIGAVVDNNNTENTCDALSAADHAGLYPTEEELRWKTLFEKTLARSGEKPRDIVELARRGFPNSLRGWAWCCILKTEQVPRMLTMSYD